MPLSKEAVQTIEMLRSSKQAATKAAKENIVTRKDPVLAQIEDIYKERHMLEEMVKKKPLPEHLTLETANADGVLGEWLRPLESDPNRITDKVFLFLHGGGFNTGSAASRRDLTANIARRSGISSFSIDYRCCPEYRYPAHLNDCVTAYLWLLKQGYAPKNISVFGESAGANLALCMTHYLKDHYLPVPGKLCVFSPVVDLTDPFPSRITRANRDPMSGLYLDEEELAGQSEHSSCETRALYCSPEEIKSPYCSPIHGDFHGFPKMMVHVGTEEILYDDATALVQKAKEAGVDVRFREWEGLFHVFPLFDIPEADIACQEIADFIREDVS